MAVADVEPLEGYFQAHAMLESTLEAKPISITRNEIYGMLSILMRHVPIIVSVFCLHV
jgi:Ras GTPase-activating-like protein IQGAP2/3